jgi:hypothetical protein
VRIERKSQDELAKSEFEELHISETPRSETHSKL